MTLAPAQIRDLARALAPLLADATARTRAAVSVGGRIDAAKLEENQRAAHGLAWLATAFEGLRQMADYAARMEAAGRFRDGDRLLTHLAAAEVVEQIFGGLPMSQVECVRLEEFGLDASAVASRRAAVAAIGFDARANADVRRALAARLLDDALAPLADAGLDDTDEAMRDQMRRFVEAEVAPHAHRWHLANAYIPLETIAKLARLGVFGLTIPEDFGGLGLSKVVMCVVTEELSRGYIGVGSLGTRSEIAAELILVGGTPEQKERYLPAIASGSILTTAVFTEPNTGSDLASLRTRAARDGAGYAITGAKTWITHPVRADLMTLLARTDPDEPGYKGLSMFLVEKPRGTDADPFPLPGLRGGEIEVLGYRGMKEFELAFDGLRVPPSALLGGVEGQGFKQLMATFESARIQTAARAVGVAENALELGLAYARSRAQFGKSLVRFPRVADKLTAMAAEIHVARQLTYHAARSKDGGRRCDVEAGMAKLYAARVAWAAADNALQIHGGNGFALEYPISRVLCDARILNIFEGAAEIQAQVVARGLLEAEA